MTFSNNIQGSDERTVDKVHSIVKELVKKGVIKSQRIDESFNRIMKLKNRLNRDDLSIYYQQAFEKSNRELEEAKRTILLEKKNVAVQKMQTPEQEELPKKNKKKRKNRD